MAEFLAVLLTRQNKKWSSEFRLQAVGLADKDRPQASEVKLVRWAAAGTQKAQRNKYKRHKTIKDFLCAFCVGFALFVFPKP
ncbi:MAG TPA: hypothetical protein VG324_03270 [Blastocatellia bacterium]|nr:hypothetical protein [Blastocatellia bacterium]